MKAEFLLVSEARTVSCDNSDIHLMFCKREPWIVLGFTAEETLISGSALEHRRYPRSCTGGAEMRKTELLLVS